MVNSNYTEIEIFMEEIFQLEDIANKNKSAIAHLRGDNKIKQIRIAALHHEIRQLYTSHQERIT